MLAINAVTGEPASQSVSVAQNWEVRDFINLGNQGILAVLADQRSLIYFILLE